MEDKEFNSINVVPMVDIMLVLLAIVLTTTTFISIGAIPVNLPKAENKTNIQNLQTIKIAITKDNKILINNLQFNKLQLIEYIKDKKNERFIIMADKDANVQSLVNVIDALNKENIKNFSVIVQNE